MQIKNLLVYQSFFERFRFFSLVIFWIFVFRSRTILNCALLIGAPWIIRWVICLQPTLSNPYFTLSRNSRNKIDYVHVNVGSVFFYGCTCRKLGQFAYCTSRIFRRISKNFFVLERINRFIHGHIWCRLEVSKNDFFQEDEEEQEDLP